MDLKNKSIALIEQGNRGFVVTDKLTGKTQVVMEFECEKDGEGELKKGPKNSRFVEVEKALAAATAPKPKAEQKPAQKPEPKPEPKPEA
jgi:hypothetical protein